MVGKAAVVAVAQDGEGLFRGVEVEGGGEGMRTRDAVLVARVLIPDS